MPTAYEAIAEPAHTDLFDPVQVGECLLANRIVMAPLTRSRATAAGTATPLMAEYYAQRATAGLIIAEGTNISPQGRGYAYTPGIYSAAQIEAWQPVTRAIHDKGGHVFVQLWHVGRISHPSLQPNGALPVAPSAICPKATSFTESGFQSCVTPRRLNPGRLPRSSRSTDGLPITRLSLALMGSKSMRPMAI